MLGGGRRERVWPRRLSRGNTRSGIRNSRNAAEGPVVTDPGHGARLEPGHPVGSARQRINARAIDVAASIDVAAHCFHATPSRGEAHPSLACADRFLHGGQRAAE